MEHLRIRPALWFPIALTVAVEAAAIALSWGREPAWDTVIYAVYSLANVVAGALINARHPGHVIGWLLSATGLLNAFVSDLGQGWALAGTAHGWPGADLADLAASSQWSVGGLLIAATFVLFPTGTLPNRGRVWPWVLPLGGLGAVVLLAGWMTGDQVSSLLVGGRSPLYTDSVPSGLLYGGGLSALAAAMVLAAVAMVGRMRRADGVERQQLKWMVFAVATTVLILPLSAPFYSSVAVVRMLDAIVLVTIPLAALAAIWRYRLYDIELIISRTVLYAAVTAVLTTCFAGLVLVLGLAFGRGSTLATAGATVAVAFAFRPLRDRLQKYVDRRFDRGRYDAHAEITRFMADLRAGRREPEEVAQVIADASSRMRSEEARMALVPSLEQEASLAIEMVQLRAELRHQLTEVRDSRLRIVEATEAERRRIERDLHDGSQQRLVSIGLALRHVQHQLGESAPPVTRALDIAVQEVTDTIEELREIARGIRPGVLDEGLDSALRDLAQRTHLPIGIDVPDLRLSDDLETAAYFIVCEGVTNATKHAAATRVDVEVRQRDGWLVVRVSDDGVGGAAPREGRGLIGVSDRVAAHGGRLRIESVPGMGTTLVAELSCAS